MFALCPLEFIHSLTTLDAEPGPCATFSPHDPQPSGPVLWLSDPSTAIDTA
jgi:hypothetical protein